MRPIIRGDCPTDEHDNAIQYTDYSNAREALINRLGEYCSYCEMHMDSSLAVEHIQPKKPPGATTNMPEREFNWFNFLLACSNCNSTKGNTDVELTDYFWPDKDNTFQIFIYQEGGLITSDETLPEAIKSKARATIELTGLDKHPLNNPQAADRRWRNRRETWDIAIRSKANLDKLPEPQMMEQIIMTAQGHGYWSIWMTVFAKNPAMLRRLIQAFPGTCVQCFDEANNYAPIQRDTLAPQTIILPTQRD